MQPSFYRAFWQPLLHPGWRAGLVLVLFWSIPRFWLVMWANQEGNYQYVSLIFLSMWIAPFLLLSREGRRAIGIQHPHKPSWLFFGFLGGLAGCALMYGLAYQAYGLTQNNWLYYISGTYSNLPAEMAGNTRFTFFLIFVNEAFYVFIFFRQKISK